MLVCILVIFIVLALQRNQRFVYDKVFASSTNYFTTDKIKMSMYKDLIQIHDI